MFTLVAAMASALKTFCTHPLEKIQQIRMSLGVSVSARPEATTGIPKSYKKHYFRFDSTELLIFLI